jgi:hypothetical protein
MKYAITVCAVLLVTASATDMPRAQGTAQSITASRVDVVQVASGYRASKVIGSPVYNESRDAIGTIDDLIPSPKDNVTYAILSVGRLSRPRYPSDRGALCQAAGRRHRDASARRDPGFPEGVTGIQIRLAPIAPVALRDVDPRMAGPEDRMRARSGPRHTAWRSDLQACDLGAFQ